MYYCGCGSKVGLNCVCGNTCVLVDAGMLFSWDYSSSMRHKGMTSSFSSKCESKMHSFNV